MATDEPTRAEMGLGGRRLVEESYSLDKVARQYLALYTWLVGRAGRPAFVY
jgi:glycosyltransferase involved in cell wall biosynthesis